MRNLALMIIMAALFDCNSNTDKHADNVSVDALTDTAAKSSRVKMDLSEPVRIDTSNYVMYKMVLAINAKDTKNEYYGSSRSYDAQYWNITFYNTLTGQHHLLAPAKKMLVDIWDGKNEDNEDADKHVKADSLLFYSVTSCDYNKDGQFDSSDPTYLFISNKAGYNFRQISPDSMHVKNWHLIRSAGKILMQVTRDTNHNDAYDEKTVPYVYDLRTGAAAQKVFTDEFKLSVKQMQQKLWGKAK